MNDQKPCLPGCRTIEAAPFDSDHLPGCPNAPKPRAPKGEECEHKVWIRENRGETRRCVRCNHRWPHFKPAPAPEPKGSEEPTPDEFAGFTREMLITQIHQLRDLISMERASAKQTEEALERDRKPEAGR